MTAVLVLATGLALLLFGLWVWSRGTPAPVMDAYGGPAAASISEKVFVDINGVRQGMIIRGSDRANPVLLFVHGGPGMPEYFLTERYPTGLEAMFTVVWWDQRGAGLSYHPDIPAATMTLEQLTSDTIAVTNYLRERFSVEKIYLMAHSGGTTFAIQAAARAPQLYYAYIGVAQMVDQLRSERLAYSYMLEAYRQRGDDRMLRRLEAAPPTDTWPLPAAYMALRDDAMHRLGVGTTRDMHSVLTGVFLASWTTTQYTLAEKLNLWRGRAFSSKTLRGEVFSLHLSQRVTRLDVPTYFLHGAYDYTCSYQLARAYAATFDAPVKGFYTFATSAHSPIFEEPEKVAEILRQDVLTGGAARADALAGSRSTPAGTASR